MNQALVRNTIHRLLSRPLSVAILMLYALFGVLAMGAQVMAESALPEAQVWDKTATAAWYLCWALGTGLLGQERRNGHLPLLLSRPISRAEYVLSRWAGLALSVIAIDVALVAGVSLWLASKNMAPPPLPLLIRWGWFIYFTLLTSAWITLLSACFGGNGDLIYFIAGSMALGLISTRLEGTAMHSTFSNLMEWTWSPGGVTQTLVHEGYLGAATYGAAVYAVAAATCLGLAAYIMQRRDISYVNR